MARTQQAWEEDEDDGPIFLGGEPVEHGAPDLGPDERDLDLMDGSWEQRYYAGRMRSRDWNSITLGLGLLVLLGLLLPAILVFFR